MSGPSNFQPKSAFLKWTERRLPILGLMHSSFVAYPTPRNLNYWWTFGGILSFCLGVQIITGIVLAMHYTPTVAGAFDSVEHIMRDVNYGWLLRYVHANGASMFFIAVYIHIFRGMYYGSYKEPREILWILGVIIFLLMMATAFMGYVLPWGQMSFWGATVITNLFSAIPGVGTKIVELLWGGYSVDQPTLQRFFSLHYLLPFMIAGVVILHIWALHEVGQNNPTGIDVKSDKDTLAFTPYATAKDNFAMVCFMIFFAWFVFYIPNYLGHADNYIPANPLQTPTHILRDPARDPEQARRRDGDVRVDRGACVPAVARSRQDSLCEVSSAVQAVLLDFCDHLHRSRLVGREARGRRLCDRLADSHRVVLHSLPGRAAAALLLREAVGDAGVDHGVGPRQAVACTGQSQRLAVRGI